MLRRAISEPGRCDRSGRSPDHGGIDGCHGRRLAREQTREDVGERRDRPFWRSCSARGEADHDRGALPDGPSTGPGVYGFKDNGRPLRAHVVEAVTRERAKVGDIVSAEMPYATTGRAPYHSAVTEFICPLTASQRRQAGRLGSKNGHGFALAGFSRTDADGNMFATRWVTVFGVGVVPRGRYYVREGKSETTTTGSFGNRSTTTCTEYTFIGATRLKAWEIARHYLFWLIVVPGSLAPLLLLSGWVDGSGGVNGFVALLCVLGIIFSPMMTGLFFVVLLMLYRTHLAPRYAVEWAVTPDESRAGRRQAAPPARVEEGAQNE